MPQRHPAPPPRCKVPLPVLLLLAGGSIVNPGWAAPETTPPVAVTPNATAPSAAPIELPFEQLPDYWLALPTTVSLSATPLPCQAGSLTARYTIGADGAIADPTVVASTLDGPHQAEAVGWITQAHYAAAPANADHRPVRVSQQMNVSCG